MPHQDGLGDNGPETTRLSKPDDGDDRMEKKSENVAHARDGIKLKNRKNSMGLANSPTTRLVPAPQPTWQAQSEGHEGNLDGDTYKISKHGCSVLEKHPCTSIGLSGKKGFESTGELVHIDVP